MTQQLLHRSNVLTALKQMSGKRMPEDVAGDALRNSRPYRRRTDGPLDRRWVKMTANRLPGTPVLYQPARRKYVLPTPFSTRRGVLSVQTTREIDMARTRIDIPPVPRLAFCDMC